MDTKTVTIKNVGAFIHSIETADKVTAISMDSPEYSLSLADVEHSKQEAVENAYGHKIILFRVIRKGADHAMSYHFHFLLTKNHGQDVAICLDTSDIVPISPEPSREEMHEVAQSILKGFIMRAGLIDQKNEWIEQKFYFNRAPQIYWDKFNKIKERDFVDYAKEAIEKDNLSIDGITEESDIQFA